MRKLLVLGGAGFIGHQVASHWVESHTDARVTVLDSMSSPFASARMQNFAARDGVRFIHGDIREPRLLQDCLAEHGFDAVLHVATGLDSGPFAPLDASEDFSASTQATMQALTGLSGPKPVLGMVVSTAPRGNDINKVIGHRVAMRPATALGVAEAVACEVALGLGRAGAIDTRVYAAPLAFGPGQMEGPVADLIAALLLGYPVTTRLPAEVRWNGVYAPDLAARVCADLRVPVGPGDIRRVVGNQGRGWAALVNELAGLLERFFATNPALKHRFPNATWTCHTKGIDIVHPGWPEQLDTGIGALTEPATGWTAALAETLRWYLSNQAIWQGPFESTLSARVAIDQ